MIEIDFLDELDRFQLALKKNSLEMQEGEQSSESTGHGMIFKDHKQYVPGDDIRRIDWKAYARTGDYFVKRYEEEKNVTLHVLLDRSSSMNYGSPSKYDYAAKIGIALAYMALNTNDRYRFSVFSETLTDISSGRRNANLAKIVDTLNSMRQTPESKIERCVTEYSSRIKNKSAVIILSDFLSDIESIESGLESLQNTDALLVNVFDSNELNPGMEGDKILTDPESDSRLRTYLSKRTKERYRGRLQEHISELEEVAHGHGAEYLQVSTQQDIFESFLSVWNLLNS
ncbi:MAG: DUF58 domain-containing protein [Candidatus Nanohaloarchaea archaeon]